MTIFQIQLNLPSRLETENTEKATSNTEIHITNSNSNYVKRISLRDSQAIVIWHIGRLTFSRKTSANVLKLDASK